MSETFTNKHSHISQMTLVFIISSLSQTISFYHWECGISLTASPRIYTATVQNGTSQPLIISCSPPVTNYTYLLTSVWRDTCAIIPFTVRAGYSVLTACILWQTAVPQQQHSTFQEMCFIYNYFIMFNVHGSMHRSNILVCKSQQDAQVTKFILSENCSTCFGFHYHPSSGA